jgi:hypothetical protein
MSIASGFTGVPGNQAQTQNLSLASQRSGAYDPVDKLRVSSPQSLIDTDFEYGTQPTKWESISLQNNRQSCYYIPQSPLIITGITGNGTTTVTIAGTFTIAANSLIYIQNSNDSNANGWWYTAAGGTNSMTVITTNAVASGAQYNAALTYCYLGFFYSSCGVPVGSNAFTTDGTSTVTVSTTNPHGLSANSLIYITNTTSSGTIVNGAQVVATVPTANSFTFVNSNGTVAAAAITNSAAANVVYARPAGYVETRSFDGGVAFSAGANVPDSQLIRQTRRYFRYQSGKGIQFSTGTTLKPSVFVTSLTSNGTTVTVTTRYAHNLAAGCVIQVAGCDQAAYNGTFTVVLTRSPTVFTYTTASVPSATTATGFAIKVSPTLWYGSSSRVGFFDQQNGLFFEYDGQTLYAVWRTSTNQLSGTVSVTQGSSSVTGTGTQFSSQVKPGDFIVIRGQSYRVTTVASDTSLYISPEYRGATLAGAIPSKTIDTRVPQSQWFDPCDGTGPSGYNLDLTRMQMWYIDYSWYGAGVIRWGFRASNGAVTYVYSQQNNNQRFEAYMRSGNMAAHYECVGITQATYLTSTLSSGTTSGGTINVADTSGFGLTGTLKVTNSGQTGSIEYISYSSKTPTTFTINARTQTGGSAAAQTFTYSATAPVGIEYASPDTVATLSHWGSSVIMDGRFDDDKSLIFNYGTNAPVTLLTGITAVCPLLAIRIAPSVDNGTTGLLGAKEIVNRMQLALIELGVVTNGTVLITLVMNGYTSGGSWGTWTSPISLGVDAVTSSLAQISVNTLNSGTLKGGESVAAFYTNSSGQTTLDLGQVRDIGNSILGGGTSANVSTNGSNVYPDGPDVLYVCATNVVNAATPTVLARLSWKEAQA